jgi:beta-galactosidase
MDEARFNSLREYVRHGGYLVLAARTALKDRYNALLPSRGPGPLAELAGVEVADYYALDEPAPVKGNWFSGYSYQWAELLNITDTNITVPAAKYEPYNGWLDGQPAITVHSYQSGLVYYVGTNLDDAAQEEFMAKVIRTANINSVLETPPGVQAARRMRPDGKEIIILINHTRQRQMIELPRQFTENLKGIDLEGKVEMAPYGVAVLTPIQT